MALTLYLIERQEDPGVYEMGSVVVAAPTAATARQVARTARGNQSPDVWAHGQAKLQKIGSAALRVKQGIVHEAFNLG